MDSDVDSLHVQRMRVVIVRDLLPRDGRIGNDKAVVFSGTQMGGPPSNIGDQSVAAFEFDPVIDAEGLFQADDDSGKEIPEDGLQGQPQNQGCDGTGCQKGGDIPVRKSDSET